MCNLLMMSSGLLVLMSLLLWLLISEGVLLVLCSCLLLILGGLFLPLSVLSVHPLIVLLLILHVVLEISWGRRWQELSAACVVGYVL
jgi:hypothetical protein